MNDKLVLAAACTLDGDCDSTHCVDTVCCATICDGNCNRCNVAGSIGTCTDVNSDCTGNCDICSSGNCAASVSLCTGNCDICSGSGTAYSCAASNALCSNTASSCNCSGSGTAFNCQACNSCYECSSYSCIAATLDWGSGLYSCAAGAATDPNRCYNGTCINCSGWGNAGYCWYGGSADQSCNTVCAAHGGVYNGTCDWTNDPLNCSTCLHYWPGATCAGASGVSPALYGAAECHPHAGGTSNCTFQGSFYTRQCACNF